MKKLLFIVGSLLSVSTLFAQKQNESNLAQPKMIPVLEERNQAMGSHGAGSRGGMIVFTEDFDNGFAGNNGLGAWTPFDNSGDTSIWMLANATSPNGAYSVNAAVMASTTASNGWIIFDADFFQGGPITASNPVVDVSGWLQSPMIDCSQLTSVLVDYEQYFRYCCFPTSPLTVEVSVDNGGSWVVFPGHGDFSPAANSGSANPLNTVVDISCVAAGQSSVLIRFGFNTANAAGYSHYFWGLDDISVYGNPKANDIELRQVTNGDVFNVWEYRLTPMEQKITSADGGLLVGVIYRNVGYNDQPNVNVNIEIVDGSGNTVHSQTENIGTVASYANAPECPAFVNDTLYVSTNWEPSAVGSYIINVSMTSDSTDETTGNNSLSREIEFSADEYGHDDLILDIEILPTEVDGSNPVEYEATGVGNFYHFPYEGSTAYGVTMLLGPTTTSGAYFQSFLINATGGLNTAPSVEASNEFTAQGDLIGATGTEPFYYLPFTDAAELLPGEVYFAGLASDLVAMDDPTFTTDYELTFLGQGNSDSDNSTAQLERAGDNSFVWFTSRSYSPAVRLILSNRVSVDEVNDETLKTFQLFPNPAVAVSTVRYELSKAAAVAYEVRDVQGKLVSYANLGVKPIGFNTIELPVSDWQVGQYEISLVVEGKRMFTRSLQVVK
jgi:hypothetical protein